MESNTAKNFALQLGSLISLYVSLGAAITLLFGVINIAFPDATEGYWAYDSAQNGIRIGIAMLVVFFPTYLVLTRLVNQVRRKEQGTYLTLTKWLIYLSLLIGGAIILGDLVAVILAYLNGEVTTRFILKATVLFVIIGAGLGYYILDARGYWQKNEQKSLLYGLAALMMTVAIVATGITYSDSPTEIRERALDQRQIEDLQDMQWRIEEFYRTEGNLPEEIDALYRGIAAPEAPENRNAYVYTVTADGFELCATFSQPSQGRASLSISRPVTDGMVIQNPHNWDHGTGEWCFERIINDTE